MSSRSARSGPDRWPTATACASTVSPIARRSWSKAPAADVSPAAASGYATEVSYYPRSRRRARGADPGVSVRGLRSRHRPVRARPRGPGAGREQGDQIRGCTVDQARVAVENLAGMHGPRWCDRSLLDIEWLALPSADGAEFLTAFMVDATGQFVERYPRSDGPGRRRGPRRLRPPASATGCSVGPSAIRSSTATTGSTTCCSRPRRGATRWRPSTGRPRGSGCLDATSPTSSATALPIDDRRAAERDLVEAYHRALVGHGVRGYDLDLCWDGLSLTATSRGRWSPCSARSSPGGPTGVTTCSWR